MFHVKTQLRVLFTDFWPTFRAEEFWFYQKLGQSFQILEDNIDPELVVFCDYGVKHLQYRCLKVYYSHEVRDPNGRRIAIDRRLCDYSFSFHGNAKGHYYFSLLVEDQFFQQIRSGAFSDKLRSIRDTPKTKFCNFVYGNESALERIAFCQELMAYKRVDCPGRVLNNQPPFDAHGYKYEKKYLFLSQYKFTIAFENESERGYTTEKLLHPFIAGSVPIYWGNPEVAKLFNPKSFINCHEFGSFDEVIEWIKWVDTQPELFENYRRELPILPDSPLYKLSSECLAERLSRIGEAAKAGYSVSRRHCYPVFRWSRFVAVKVRNHWVYRKQRFTEWFGRVSRRIASLMRVVEQGSR